MSQKLSFKTAGANMLKQPQVTCPYVGPAPINNAEYVRTCKKLPNLCSCTYWKDPNIFNICWAKIQADQEGDEQQ